MSWTDERIDRLREMWTRGMTASQIAEDLGGVSRNAVIGKAHRLGLQARPSPVKPNEPSAAAPVEAAPAAAPPPPPPPPPSTDFPATTALDVEGTPPFDLSDEEPEADVPDQSPRTSFPAVTAPVPQPKVISIGPGGFVRQGPGEQQAPIPPAPPRRLVPAKPSPEIADRTGLLDLNEKICKWPLGHPGEPDFHFCGRQANPGFPYCVEHCGVAYQAQLPRRDRKPPPPLPFGGPRVR